mmetsp:Transcript_28750/g.57342  ORF Transcript_28750/g.57342 Transcript_28750/m.57342 type:complete len:622 (-) Transcript_28750:423-2288(-)
MMANTDMPTASTSPLLAGGEPRTPSSLNYSSIDADNKSQGGGGGGLRKSEASTSIRYDEKSEAVSEVSSEGSHPYGPPKTTVFQTFVHLLKGYIGPGCLSLPWAVSQVGVVIGSLAIAIMSFWSSYNCWTIVKIKRHIEKINARNEAMNNPNDSESKSEVSSIASSALTYPEVGEWAYGETFQKFVSAMICTQQLAICTVFFSFIGENIYAVCELVPEVVPGLFLSHVGVMTTALPFIMGLSFIPDLDALTPVMVAGTVSLFSAFGVLGYVIGLLWGERPMEPLEVEWKSAPLALCAILYSYEGICLILPIESAMKEPKKFKKTFLGAMACVALILAGVANICVIAFGEVTNGSVTAFLLEKYQDDKATLVFLMIANTAVSLSVLFTYPIQLFPVIELVGPKAMAWWYGRGNEPFDEEHDLSGFDPMPTLPEHEEAEHEYNDFEKKESEIRSNGNHAESSDEKKSLEPGLRASMMSNITDAFPKMSIPGDSIPLRVMLVLLTYTVAVIVPNVQALISLAGAIAGSSTALLIPPILELALIEHIETSKPGSTSSPKPTPPLQSTTTTHKDEFIRRLILHDLSGKYWKKKLKNYILFWTGVVFFLIGAYASVADIVSIWIGKE